MKVKVEWDLEVDDGTTTHDLPDEVIIPVEVLNDPITDFLSDTYGYLVRGWRIA